MLKQATHILVAQSVLFFRESLISMTQKFTVVLIPIEDFLFHRIPIEIKQKKKKSSKIKIKARFLSKFKIWMMFLIIRHPVFGVGQIPAIGLDKFLPTHNSLELVSGHCCSLEFGDVPIFLCCIHCHGGKQEHQAKNQNYCVQF